MKFYLNLFSPETWRTFREHGADVSGFSKRQLVTAQKIEPGNIFLCYLVRVSRWCGVLKVVSNAFQDSTPIFLNPDPFVVRFKVSPSVMLDLEYAIPVEDDAIWSNLSLTKNIEKGSVGWGANFQGSLRTIPEADGEFLVRVLGEQAREKKPFPLTEKDRQRLARKKSIQAAGRTVLVDVPDADEEAIPQESDVSDEIRQSHRIQAILVKIGAELGFKSWLPRNDRQAVLTVLGNESSDDVLDALPLNYDEVTLKTIQQIDVIWLKKRSIVRAFEVEHTTAIYSGLLRMADLLALQPNMDIRLHIVAPDEKREKVLREIQRPVFSLLERGPLYEHCSYIPYSAINKIAETKHLGHMHDSIIQEYEIFAEED